jgi:hypothetical protein
MAGFFSDSGYPQSDSQGRLNAAIDFANSGRNAAPVSAPVQQQSADTKRLTMFESAADKYGVPVDVLLGMAEKDSNFNPLARSQGVGQRRRGIIAMSDEDVSRDGINPYVPAQAIDSAAKKIKSYIDQGLSVDDAVKAYVGGPDKGQWGPQTDEYLQDVLSRSKRLADQYYPADPAEAAMAQDAPRAEPQQNSEIGDVGRQVVGGAVKGAGATIQGAAEASKAVRHVAGLPEYRSMGDALAEAFNKWGSGVQEGVSAETKKAISDSSPDGNILKPGTWTLGKNPSLRGYVYLGLDIFGQMLPVVAGGVAARGSAVVGATIGGLQGGGAAADEARKTIDAMSPQDREQLPIYKEAIKDGKTPDQALRITKSAAGRMAFLFTLPVSALGGAATSKLVSPATRILEGGGRARQAIARGALGSLEEGTQEAAEGVTQRMGVNEATGAQTDVAEQTFGDFIAGAMGGGAPAAAGGAMQRPGPSSSGEIDQFVTDAKAAQKPMLEAPPDFRVDTAGRAAPAGAPSQAEDAAVVDVSSEAARRQHPGYPQQGSPEPQPALPAPPNFEVDTGGTARPRATTLALPAPPDFDVDEQGNVNPRGRGDGGAPPAPPARGPEPPPTPQGGGLTGALRAGSSAAGTLAELGGKRIVVRDESGEVEGTVVEQTADDFVFKTDDGQEMLITNQEVTSGAVELLDAPTQSAAPATPLQSEAPSQVAGAAEPTAQDAQQGGVETPQPKTSAPAQAESLSEAAQQTVSRKPRLGPPALEDQEDDLLSKRRDDLVKQARVASENVAPKIWQHIARIDDELARRGVKVEVKKSQTGLDELGGDIGAGIVGNLYDGLFKALSDGKTKFAGVDDPILKRARPLFDSGKIKSADDLRRFANGDPEFANATKAEEPKVQKSTEKPKSLGADLAGAKPRYSFGAKQFDLSFDNDIDKAAYIAAQKTPSKRDSDYVKFVSDATGMSEDQVREHGANVRDAIKAQARDAKPGNLNVGSIHNATQKPAPSAPTKPAKQEAPAATSENVNQPTDEKRKQVLAHIKNNFWGAAAAANSYLRQNTWLADTHEVKNTKDRKFQIVPKAKSAEGDMEKFPADSGTLGVPRAEMPQVPTQAHGGLVRHLNAKGIERKTKDVPASDMKPTQAEFSPAKVERAKEEGSGDRAVIVSNDGHIIDGHHQAIAAAEQGENVKAIVLDAPVKEALEAVKASPSADESNGGVSDAKGRKLIGRNTEGKDLWEDERGVRSIKENGIVKTEPVGIVPSRGGMGISTNRDLHPEYKTADEVAAKELSAKTAEISSGKPSEPSKGESAFIAHVRGMLEGDSDEKAFRNIMEARKLADELVAKAPEGIPFSKFVDELVERAVVQSARNIVATNREKGESSVATFEQLVRLYNKQPNLSSRTSASVSEQAYSTPAPLAYVASRLAGIEPRTDVLEPSAGNGMLLIDVNPSKNAVVAEINPMRAKALDDLGFSPIMMDATSPEMFKQQAGKMQAVIANPPFGTVMDGGRKKSWKIDGYRTDQIDHAIALNALRAMAPDGRAVLILGGVKGMDPKERANGYSAPAKRSFYHRLFTQYNVTDVFTVDGKQYAKQGAQWPVDVVVIDGKNTSGEPWGRRDPLTKTPPELLQSWSEIGNKLNGVTQAASTEGGAPAGNAASTRAEPTTNNDVGGGSTRTSEPQSDIGAKSKQPESVGGEPDSGQRESASGGASVGAEPRKPAMEGRQRKRADTRADSDGKRTVDRNQDGQSSYDPASREGDSLNTLVPANLKDSIESAFQRIFQEVGDIDDYVAQALGRKPEELSRYFSAEQIDAIAMGIWNIEKGDGFIIGDQTGIGKGRVVAAMIAYAKKNGSIPVFVTEKPDLYGDMWRDLHDIGWDKQLGRPINMAMTNSGVSVPLDDDAVTWVGERDAAKEIGEPIPERYGAFSKAQNLEKATAALHAIVNGDMEPDVVFTTYDQMNSVKGQETPRRNFLRRVAPKAFLIMDETHNAGGAAGESEAMFEEKDKAPPRSELFREVIGLPGQADKVRAVVYSSATYAKSPRVMTLFSRTDIAKAVDKPSQLPELIQRGGIPLQQVVSSMLASAGQYLRRERSFEGVNYDMEPVAVDESAYGNFTKGLRAVFEFDRSFAVERSDIADGIAAEMGAGKQRDGSVGEGGASSTTFSSVMHNIIGQMILSITAQEAGKRAVKAIEAGERPVIALSKTNEAFLSDFVDSEGLKVGDIVDLSFVDMLKRYLVRTRRITVKIDKETKHRIMIDFNQMEPETVARYNEAMDLLNRLNLGDLPISPIDAIRNGIQKAGHSVAEVTGRDIMLDYSQKAATLAQRPKTERGPAGKKVSIRKFNNGELDVLILNRSGSTGVSMHASKDPKVKDKRRRRMILVEADPNIDTHMQMLGRVHRTGQVVTPNYSQIVADIPATVRPTAVLMRKMASLNANTTGSAKSKFSSDAVDFMNKYGDEVVAEVIGENLDIADLLNVDLPEGEIPPGYAAKVTGRLTLLDPAEQQEFIDNIVSRYKALIEKLDAEGKNDLEAKYIDLQARTLESQVTKPGTGLSPFESAVNLEKVSIKSQGRAMTFDDIVEHIKRWSVAARRTSDNLADIADEVKRETDARIANVIEDAKKYNNLAWSLLKDDVAKQRHSEEFENNLRRWRALSGILSPGETVHIELDDGEMTPAIVLEIRDTGGRSGSPIALSKWAAVFALPDSRRTIQQSFTWLKTENDTTAKAGASLVLKNSGSVRITQEQLSEQFEKARAEGRETRYMFTGNILSAFDQTKGGGQIINHSMEDGSVRPAILMGRKFAPKDFMAKMAVRFKTGSQVMKFLDAAKQPSLKSSDGVISISNTPYSGYVFTAMGSKKSGGKYYADRRVRAVYDSWEKRQGMMVAKINNRELAQRLVEALMSVEAIFETTKEQDVARKVVEQEAPKASMDSGNVGTTADALKKRLSVGKDSDIIERALSSGRVVIHDDAGTLPAGAPSTPDGMRIQGVTTPDGVIHLVASNLTPTSARAVLLHEAFHSAVEPLIGSRQFEALLGRIQGATEAALDRGDASGWWDEALRRAGEAGTPSAEEIAAYAIENRERAPAGILESVDNILGTVKAWALRFFGRQFGSVTPGEVRALALAALRDANMPTPPTDGGPGGYRFSLSDDAASHVGRAREWMSDHITDFMTGSKFAEPSRSILAFIPVRPLFLEMAKGLPSARRYLATKGLMDTMRNDMAISTDAILQKWFKWANKVELQGAIPRRVNRGENKNLMDMMHESTLAGVDPSKAFQPIMTRGDHEALADADPSSKQYQIAAERQARDQARRASYGDLKKRYDTMTPTAQELYREVRDYYKKMGDEAQELVIDNVARAMQAAVTRAERAHADEMQRIDDDGLEGDERDKAVDAADKRLNAVRGRSNRTKAARLRRLRQQFESNKVQEPYFPLARFGSYYVTVRDKASKAIVSFSKFERSSDASKFAKEMSADENLEVKEGHDLNDKEWKDQIDPNFIVGLDDILTDNNIGNDVRDQIWQSYLRTLPDLSIRKQRIHRKGTEGFNTDAMRAFAKLMFHAGHQMARLKYGLDLTEHMDNIGREAKNAPDAKRSAALFNEMNFAHQYAMNPDGKAWSYNASSMSFLWTMAFNLSSALVNIDQTVSKGLGILAFDLETNAGIKNAASELAKATADFMRGKGKISDSSNVTDAEREAIAKGYESGVIDRTQAHELASIAESGVSYNPMWQSVMKVAGLPMHHTERFNREVTFLAAFRIAKKAGMNDANAFVKASDLTFATHYETQSSAKPRFMRSNLARVAFALKSYQANVLFRAFWDFNQSIKGATPEERKMAIGRFTTMVLMSLPMAGVRGMFAYSTVMAIASFLYGLAGGDDDDLDEKLRKTIVNAAGDNMLSLAVAGMILEGIPGYVTGTALSDRIGMADMWFRSVDREMNPEQKWMYLIDQIGGPGVSILHQGFVAANEYAEGKDVHLGEKVAPAFIRNLLKAYRYAAQGVTDKDMNPIVEHVPVEDILKQAIGFTPAQIRERMDRNNFQRNAQRRITNERSQALAAAARARMGHGDTDAAQRKVDTFNDKYPSFMITGKTITQSVKARNARGRRMEFGVDLNPKLAPFLKEMTSGTIY